MPDQPPEALVKWHDKRAGELEGTASRAVVSISTMYLARARKHRATAALLRELAELRAKLPKTADGVPVTPGMSVFYLSPAGVVETPEMDSWTEIEGTLGEDEYVGPQEFYSTRAAALAAKEASRG